MDAYLADRVKTLYQKRMPETIGYSLDWLSGLIQAGVTAEMANCANIEKGNAVRDAYYNGEPPPFLNDIYGYLLKCGSLKYPNFE